MRRIQLLLTLAAASCLGACATTNVALAPSPLVAGQAKMPEGSEVAGPAGFTEMCARDPASCVHPETLAVVEPADPLALIQTVNRQVNSRTRQISDMQRFGVEERWEAAGDKQGAQGDCEDISIEKRRELVAAGFPDDRLLYAVGYRRDLGAHTVLIARTEGGDVVLDSRTPYVATWSQAPYVWLMRQSTADPKVWEDMALAVYAPQARPAPMVVAELHTKG